MSEYREEIWKKYSGLLEEKMKESGAGKSKTRTNPLIASAVLYATAEFLHDYPDALSTTNEGEYIPEIKVLNEHFPEFGNRLLAENGKIISADPESVFHAFKKNYSLICEASWGITIKSSIQNLEDLKINGHSILKIMLDTLEAAIEVLYTVPRFISTVKCLQDEVTVEKIQGDVQEKSIDEKIAERNRIKTQLKSKVRGQDCAVDKFADGYIRYILRGKTKGKPAATYLFAGPPGVGKTYLAQTFSELIKEEGYAYKQFDMSAYRESSSITGLVGFEKTWKGSQPGLLTGFVREHPRCVLLFDEIEKADRSVIQLFLSVLEGAELTDRFFDQQVSFEQAILIFTTNEGKDLYVDNRDVNLTLMSDQQVVDGLGNTGFPPEMISRFAAGNIIMFNHLNENYLKEVFINCVCSALLRIKDKMTGTGELKFSYAPEMSAELYIASKGGNVDARNVSSDAGKIAENLVVDALEEANRQGMTLSELEELRLVIDKDSMSDEVKKGFDSSKLGRLLYYGKELGQSDELQRLVEPEKAEGEEDFYNPDSLSEDSEKAPIKYILIDLFHGLPEDGYYAESMGYKCLEKALEKQSLIPVLVVDSERFSEEERKMLLRKGVRDFVPGLGGNENNMKPLIDILRGFHFVEFIRQMVRDCNRVSCRKHYVIKKRERRVEIVYSGLQLVRNDTDSSEDRRIDRKYLMVSRPEVRLKDVFGNKLAKEAILRCIDNIRNPGKYRAAGGKLMKGILMYGAPGMGKTMFAKAMAYESGASFISAAGSDFTVSGGIECLGEIFKVARRRKPCIIFIDEFDAVSRRRSGSGSYDEKVLEKLLKEMDGVESNNDGVYVVAATNEYPENLDRAVTRRFSEKILFPHPTMDERIKFIESLIQRKKLNITSNAAGILSIMMIGHMDNYAEIESFFEGAISEAIYRNTEVTEDYLFDRFHNSVDGEKRQKSDVVREFATAYHEAGHSLLQWKLGREIQYVTIVSRSDYGGYALAEVKLHSGQDFLDQICISYAGRVAEVVLYHANFEDQPDYARYMDEAVNIGASDDFAKATDYAYNYVCRYGFLEDNRIVIPSRRFNGHVGGYVEQEVLPEKMKEKIWEKVEEVLEEQWKRTLGMLQEHKEQLCALAYSLYYKRELTGEEICEILNEEKIHAEDTCFEQLPDFRLVPVPGKGEYYYPWGSPIFPTLELAETKDYKEKRQRSGESFIYVVKRKDGYGKICGDDLSMAINLAWDTGSNVRRFTEMEAAEAYLAMKEYLAVKSDGIIDLVPILDGMDIIDDVSEYSVSNHYLIQDREYLRSAEEKGIRPIDSLISEINSKMLEGMEEGKDIQILVRVTDDEMKKQIAEYLETVEKRGRLL